MSDEQKNDKDDTLKPTNAMANNVCAICKKNPCVCPQKSKTKPPKLTWI